MKYILLIFLSGCGVTHQHNFSKIDGNVEVKVKQEEPYVIKVDNGLIEAADFCDYRYGYKSSESEECFKDFRNYFNITPEFDSQIALLYCTNSYTDIELVEICMEDLSTFYKAEL